MFPTGWNVAPLGPGLDVSSCVLALYPGRLPFQRELDADNINIILGLISHKKMTICLIKIEGSFNISLILLKILVLNNDNSEGGAEWYASQNPALDIDITCSRFDRLMRFQTLYSVLLYCNATPLGHLYKSSCPLYRARASKRQLSHLRRGLCLRLMSCTTVLIVTFPSLSSQPATTQLPTWLWLANCPIVIDRGSNAYRYLRALTGLTPA